MPTGAGFVYLAVVLDAFSRRVVGWSMANHLRAELVLDALGMAVGQRRPRGVIHHSDQGSQYTSLAFGNRCREAGVRPSMGSVGDAYDNAMCESFSSTLECELCWRVAASARRPRPACRFSATSRASATCCACTRRWATDHPPPTSGSTPQPQPLPRDPASPQPVHENGANPIAVDLEHAREASEVRRRASTLAISGVAEGDHRRCRSGSGAVVGGTGPEPSDLGPAAPGIEHWRRRIVGEHPGCCQDRSQALSVTQMPRSRPWWMR